MSINSDSYPLPAYYTILNKISKFLFLKRTILFFTDKKGRALSVPAINNNSNLQIQRALWQDYEQHMAEHAWLNNKETLARQRLLNGDQLYFAFRDGVLVHVIWVRISDQVDSTYELGRKAKFSIDSPVPILYDAWTPEYARGQGVYPLALRHVSALLHKTYPRTWIYCSKRNYASISGIKKAGFRLSISMSAILIFRIPIQLRFKKHDD